jgi:hypothetical protein
LSHRSENAREAMPALQERRKSSLALARERSRTVSNIIQRLDGKIYLT